MKIKRITINLSHGCRGIPSEFFSEYISFSSNRVKYVKKPDRITKSNPRVEYSYDPQLEQCLYNNESYPGQYHNDFIKLCEVVESAIGKTEIGRIYDAIPTTVDIYYDDNKKVTIGLDTYDEELEKSLGFIFEMIDKYKPNNKFIKD